MKRTKMSIEQLKKLKPKLNIERSVRDILRILKRPESVYGHGLISRKEWDRAVKKLDKLTADVLEIRHHLGLLNDMDRLNYEEKKDK